MGTYLDIARQAIGLLAASVAVTASTPEPVSESAANPLAELPFVDWVRRPEGANLLSLSADLERAYAATHRVHYHVIGLQANRPAEPLAAAH